MEFRSKCDRDMSSPQSNSNTTLDSLSNEAFSPINLIGSQGGQSKLDDRHSLTNPTHSPAQRLMAPQKTHSDSPKSSMHAAVASLFGGQPNSNQIKFDLTQDPLYSSCIQYARNMLTSSNNSLSTVNSGDNPFDQDPLSRAHSFRDNFSLFASNGSLGGSGASSLNSLNLSNLNNLSNLSNQNNQNNQNRPISSLNDHQRVSNMAADLANYGLDLNCDLNNVIANGSLLSAPQKSASLNSTSLNSASTYNQLLQRFYPFISQQSIYSLFNAGGSNSTIASSSNSSFGSSSLKNRFTNNPQLYANSLAGFNSKFDLSKADLSGQEASSKCNSPNHDDKLDSQKMLAAKILS